MPFVTDIIEKIRLNLIHIGLIKREWKQIERFEKVWAQRITKMSLFIPKETCSILDIGCGEMYLKKIIPQNIDYLGIDYVLRGEDSKVYNINHKEFPTGHYDVIFMSGILEYATNLPWLLEKVYSQCNHVILSYAILENFNDIKIRKGNAWKNHMSEEQLLNVLNSPHFKITNKTFFSNQIILHISKIL